jgi:hypothetical protein
MGGVGSATQIDHIMVVNGKDDCFEWFGGTVNASYLICDSAGDDMFDMDLGYLGKVTNILGRQKKNGISSKDPNGFECDNNPAGVGPTPNTQFTVENATLCGIGEAGAQASYGGVFRRGVKGSLTNVVITGFDDGVSLRNEFGTAAAPSVPLTNGLFFGNVRNNIGTPHNDTAEAIRVDPVAWFQMGTNNMAPTPGPFTVADCQGPTGPNAAVTGSGTGAFKADATWATGLWVEWSTF